MRQDRKLGKAIVSMVVCLGTMALVSGCVWNKWGSILTNEPGGNISPRAHGEMFTFPEPTLPVEPSLW